MVALLLKQPLATHVDIMPTVNIQIKWHDGFVSWTLNVFRPVAPTFMTIAYWASGCIEAGVSKEGDIEDYVAAPILVTEADGKIIDLSGKPVGRSISDFIAPNGSAIHDNMVVILHWFSFGEILRNTIHQGKSLLHFPEFRIINTAFCIHNPVQIFFCKPFTV